MPNINNGLLDGLRRIGGRFRDLTIDGGLPGAPLGFRMRGANQVGPPTTGTHKTGDESRDRTGRFFMCTAGGTPGTWVQSGAGSPYFQGAGAQVNSYGSSGDPGALRAAMLRPYWAALGGRAAAGVNHLWIGDSITEGCWSGGALTITLGVRWVDLLLAALRQTFQPAGIAGGAGYYATGYAATVGNSPWTFTGAPVASSSYGIGQKLSILEAAGTMTLTFTGTGFDLFYVKGPVGGDFTVTVDGGGPVTVHSNAGSVTQSNVYQIRSLTAGSHTVVVTWVSGWSIVEGALVYNGDEAAGLRGIECGHSGWTAGNWVAANPVQMLQTQIPYLKPALVTIYLGSNEINTGVSAATFQTNMATLVSTILTAAGTNPISVILLNGYNSENKTQAQWAPYNAANQAVVQGAVLGAKQSVGIVDLASRFGDASVDPLGLTYDHTHPLPPGHQMLADMLYGFARP